MPKRDEDEYDFTAEEMRFFDRNPFIQQEKVNAITEIDRSLLQLGVKRSVVRVLSNLNIKDVAALQKFTYPWNRDVVDADLFSSYRSVYEEMELKQASVSDALDMYDLSESDADKQASMKEFIVQFYEFVKK